MKALVCVKRVIDYNVKIQIKPDQSGVQTDNVKMSMNPFDEIALEEALRLREQGVVTEVVAVSIGLPVVEDVLRQALAMGADRATLIEQDAEATMEPLWVAKILAAEVAVEQPDCIIMGKQAIDDDCNQTGQMLAGLLGWPQATFASKVVYVSEQERFSVTREVDGGLERLSVQKPCVITTDLRLNTPRFIPLPNILRARAKPLQRKALADYGLAFTPRLTVTKVEAPPVRQAGQKFTEWEPFLAALDKDGVLR